MAKEPGAVHYEGSKILRVFLGMFEVAGYFHYLKKGFDDLGIPCDFFNIAADWRHYGKAEDRSLLNQWINWTIHCPLRGPLRVPKTLALSMLEAGLYSALLGKASFQYDLFIFGFRSSLLSQVRPVRYIDLPVLKALGKKIVCVFMGSDARPPYLAPAHSAGLGEGSPGVRIARAKTMKRHIRFIESYADAIVCLPTYAHFFTRPCISYLAIGVPHAVATARPQAHPSPSSHTVRVLHAPSNLAVKGTLEIRSTVERLRQEGCPIELVEIVDQPNSVVVKELQRCDFVIDQLYSDTPMAHFATEAAHLGKPSVVGSYGVDILKRMLDPKTIPPSAFCHPCELEATIRRLVEDRAYRLELGAKAQDFVGRHWSGRNVAARYLRLPREPAPAAWCFDPMAVDYIHGCGLSEEQTRRLIREVIDHGGREALQLEDKPRLRDKILDFAGIES